MQGRDKQDFNTLISTDEAPIIVTIIDYDFLLDSPDKEYIVFILKDDPQHFYFGGKVLTDQMRHLDSEGYGDEIRHDGIPVKFVEKKSKKANEQGRYNYYTAVTFFPDEDGTGMEAEKAAGQPEKAAKKK
jgi:hypothetical protein